VLDGVGELLAAEDEEQRIVWTASLRRNLNVGAKSGPPLLAVGDLLQRRGEARVLEYRRV